MVCLRVAQGDGHNGAFDSGKSIAQVYTLPEIVFCAPRVLAGACSERAKGAMRGGAGGSGFTPVKR